MIASDEEDACTLAAEILSYLPDHNMADPPVEETADPKDRKNTILETLVPDNPNKPYDMVKVVEEIVDDGIFDLAGACRNVGILRNRPAPSA